MLMLEYGNEYAEQTLKNSKKLAECLYVLDFNVLCPDLDFTGSNKLVIDIRSQGSSSEISRLEQITYHK